MATDSISRSASPTAVLRLTGEHDIATAHDLRRQLAPPAGDPAWSIVVDLSAVTFMDCGGLRPLLEAQARIGNRVRFTGVSRPVARLLALTDQATAFAPALTRPPVPRSTDPSS